MSDYKFWDEMWNTSNPQKEEPKEDEFDEDHALDMVLNQMIEELENDDDRKDSFGSKE